MECNKCGNGMRWNKDNSFYQMDGFWSCLCGKIVYKNAGIRLQNYTHHTGVDDRPVVTYINVRRK